jgi:hypothetical protein
MKWINLFILFYAGIACASERPVIAEKLFDDRQYFDAVTEYKRFVFHNPESEILDTVYMQIGISNRYLGELEQSEKYFDLSLHKTQNDAFVPRIWIEKAINNLILRDTESASLSLHKALHITHDENIIKQAYFYLTVLHVLESEYEQAREMFTHYALSAELQVDSEKLVRMYELFDSASQMNLKNKRRAKLLSTFLPGSGQIYCRSYFDGTTAFLINTSLFLITGMSVINADYLDAFIFGYFLRMFYTGNRIRTELICIDLNKGIQSKYQQKVLLELFGFSL